MRAPGLWGRRSRFDRGALSVLVAEIFLPTLWQRRPRPSGELLMYQSLLKSLNRLNPRAWDFIQLTRMDKPIGIYLLLWPTLWALWIAGKGSPSLANIVIFVLGVVLTRAGGCVINDWADRKVDGHVKRTEQRPLVSGKISSKEALVFFALLMGVSFLLVLCTNASDDLAVVWRAGAGVQLSVHEALHLLPASGAGRGVLLGHADGVHRRNRANCRPRRGCCRSPTCCGRWVTTPITR